MRDTLRTEVVEFLEKHGPATATEIALGVRARRSDVEQLLTSGGFRPTQRPEGANPRGVYFEPSQHVPVKRDGKSRALAMLEVLEDGRRHTRDDIFRRSGRYFLTNNAAAELRRAGYDVRHEQDSDVHIYWLAPAASPAEPEAQTLLADDTHSPTVTSDDASGSADEATTPQHLFAQSANRGPVRTGHAA